MNKSIFFAVLLIIIFVFILCKVTFKFHSDENYLGPKIRNVIDYEITRRKELGIDQKCNNIYLVFYQINNKEYLMLYFSENYGYSQLNLLRYYNYKEKVIIYEGVNDSLAGRYLTINNMSILSRRITEGQNKNTDEFLIENYQITNDKFIKFKPTTKHHEDCINHLTKENYLVKPPPTPAARSVCR